MDNEARFQQAEDAIRQLNQRLVFHEGRSYALEQALLAMLEVFGVEPKVYFTVQKYLHEGRVAAINSPEPEIKVEAADQLSVLMLQLMEAAIKREQEQQKPVDNPQ